MVRKKKKYILYAGVSFAVIILALNLFLFTSPEPRLTKKEGSSVKIIGNISDLRKTVQSTSVSSSKNQGLMGGKDLCHPDSPFGECLPPEGSVWAGEREKLELKLNDKQITDLVNEFKPKTLLLSDILFEFTNDTAKAQATSYYPIAPGHARTEILVTRERLIVKKLYLGRVPVPEKIRKMFEQALVET
jgi:hypothetical protein